MSKSIWTIDPMHSEIMFRIKHMLITNVSGTFDMFQSTIEAENKDFSDMEISFILAGKFCIRGVEKDVELEILHTGIGLDLYGQTKAGFEINGTINRSDYGLTWNAAAEDGGLALGEEITIQISCQFILQ